MIFLDISAPTSGEHLTKMDTRASIYKGFPYCSPHFPSCLHTALCDILGKRTFPSDENALHHSYHVHCLTRHGNRSTEATLNVRYRSTFLTPGAQLPLACIRPHHCLESMMIPAQKLKYSLVLAQALLRSEAFIS